MSDMATITSHRLKTRNLRTHRSLAPLDTSNPNYKTSPVRNRLASPIKSSIKKSTNNSFSFHKSKSPPSCRIVDNRDREIERLNRLLDGGRSYDVVSIESNLRNNDKLIAHQNLQIEFLQDKNHQLERRLQEFMDAKREVINEKHRNDDLIRAVKKVEIEKHMVENAADRELDHAKYEIQRSRDELNTLDSVVQQLEVEKRNLLNDLKCMKDNLDSKNNEINNLHELIDKIQDDKSKLTKKISKLLDNEKELVTELDSLKSAKRGVSAQNRNSTAKTLTAKLDSHIKNIENERDFYKQEVDTLQKLLKAAQHEFHIRSFTTTRCGDRSLSPTRRSLSNHKSRKDQNGLTNGLKSFTKSTSPRSQTRCSVCSDKISAANRSSPSKNINITNSKYNSSLSSANNEEIKQLRRERDELQSLLDKFERHMAEIQSNVKILTSERDKFNHLYEETRDELQRSRSHELKISCNKAPNVSLAAQAILKRVETERDTALFDLRNALTDRDSYREKLKLTTESAIKDKANLEQQIEDLQNILRNSEMDKKELCHQIDLLQNQLDQLDAKVQAQNYHLVQTTQDLNDQKSASTQIRLLAEDSERALDELRRQLGIKHEELHNFEQANFRLEKKLMDLQELNHSLKDEINSLRMTVNALDKDKDDLLMALDEKAVENVALKEDLNSKVRDIDELNQQLAQLDTALDRANDELKSRLKEISQMRVQVEHASEENNDLHRRYESGARENKRLQDDLITVTRENQVLHCELDKSNGDKDHLKEQLQDYINEVQKFEELLNQKEHDRSNLLDQYRDITNELNSMKVTLNSFEAEANNLKVDCQMKHNENKRIRERLDQIEREYQQQLSIGQEYEVKLSGANRNLQRCEEALKSCQQENNELGKDLMHTRDLNSRLEQCKEDLTRQLTSKELDYEQLHNELADKRAETDLLKSQINSERTMVKNLEELIANNREKDFQMQLSTQERDSEIKLLKDRIILSEQKIQTQNKEINSLRSKLVEYESETERLKRQLTNERFERERAAQELRKLGESAEIVRYRSISPCRNMPPVLPLPLPLCPPPPCHMNATSGSSAAAAVAAAAAAVAASNVAAVASGYRSLSPTRRSFSPDKESLHLSSSGSSLRYSSESRRNHSPNKGMDCYRQNNNYLY